MMLPTDSLRKTILVVELDYHIDLLDIFLLLIDKNTFSVHCLTTKQIYNALSPGAIEGIQFHFFGQNEITSLVRTINPALIFFNTCASHYKTWSKIQMPVSVLRIHNIKTFFSPLKSIRKPYGFYEIRKWITHFLWRIIIKNDIYFRKKLLKKISSYSFLSESNLSWFNSNFPGLAVKSGPLFPITVFDSRFIKDHPGNPLKIVIPGTFESKRKDIAVIKELVKSISESSYEIELTFAGKTSSQMLPVISEFKKRERKGFSIIHFREFLPLNEFDEIVKDADILVFPIKMKTFYKIFTEFYGKSKISGNSKDLIRYGKYSVIPEDYRIQGPEKSLIFAYGNKNEIYPVLEKAIKAYMENFDEYLLKIVAHKNAYSFDALKAEQNEKLNQLIS